MEIDGRMSHRLSAAPGFPAVGSAARLVHPSIGILSFDRHFHQNNSTVIFAGSGFITVVNKKRGGEWVDDGGGGSDGKVHSSS